MDGRSRNATPPVPTDSLCFPIWWGHLGVGLFSPEASSPDPFIGTNLDGRYEVQACIGTGAVGVVYRGRHVQLGRAVAIKILQQGAAAQPESRQRFEREAKALSVLAHPNIVTVTDSGVAKGTPYLVMELLLGKTLADLLAEGPLPTARAVDIARQVLRGLAFAHGKGIVHRDLKPANVFLQSLPDHADHVKLLDFGVAKFLDLSSSPTSNDNLTRIGTVFGTPAYMSPEQARGEVVDARSDVYAAGVILFELLTGRPPFRAPTLEGIRRAHVSEPVASLVEARPGFAAAPFLQPIVERALAASSARRFPDATSMLAALEAITAVSRVVGTASAVAHLATDRASRGHVGAQGEALSRLRRGLRWFSGSWRSAATLVSLFAGLTTVVTFVRHDAGKSNNAGALPGVPIGGERSHSSPSDPPAPVPPPGARAARPAARDPWKAPVPAVLQAMRDKLERGDHLSENTLRPVHAFARQNPADPRPWLLIARTYARFDWLNDSVERYLHAYRLDPGCRGDPQMLADLRRAAVHPGAARSAAKAIQDIFGAEALPDLAQTGPIPSGHKAR